jgi:hypothetical protein
MVNERRQLEFEPSAKRMNLLIRKAYATI